MTQLVKQGMSESKIRSSKRKAQKSTYNNFLIKGTYHEKVILKQCRAEAGRKTGLFFVQYGDALGRIFFNTVLLQLSHSEMTRT